MEGDLDWAIRELRQHRFDTDWKEMEELRELNFRIEDACRALVWFLTREPSAGIQIPNGSAKVVYERISADLVFSIPTWDRIT